MSCFCLLEEGVASQFLFVTFFMRERERERETKKFIFLLDCCLSFLPVEKSSDRFTVVVMRADVVQHCMI